VTYHITAYCTIIDPNSDTVCPVRNRPAFLFQCAGASVVVM
jgi:hypothetical protein